MNKIVFYTFNIIFLIGCANKSDKRDIVIKNNSESDIVYSLSNSNMVLDIDPSMIHRNENNDKTIIDLSHLYIDSLSKKESRKILNKPNHWKNFIDPNNDGEKMRLFIIAKDSVRKYGWDGIYKNNIYNKLFLLDINDLDSLNWVIEYKGE